MASDIPVFVEECNGYKIFSTKGTWERISGSPTDSFFHACIPGGAFFGFNVASLDDMRRDLNALAPHKTKLKAVQ